MHKLSQFLLPYIFLFILSYPAIKPLLSTGFFPMHDDTQPTRVFEMAKALSQGQFPVRIVADLGYGYGYPLFNFYAPFPYYLGAVFYLTGMDIISATKLMILTGFLLAGVSMYLLVKESFGTFGGLISGILYTYAPYHAVLIYVRGAVGELYAYGFLPLLLLGIVQILKAEKIREVKIGVLTGTCGLAFILLSHNILGMLSLYYSLIGVIILGIYHLVNRKSLFVIRNLFLFIFLGIGLSAFFVAPAIFEKKYTSSDQLITGGSDFRNHFVYLSQLWDSPWGFAGSSTGLSDGMSFRIGKVHIVFGIIGAIAFWYRYRRKQLSRFRLLIIYSLSFIVGLSVFLMFNSSLLFWQILPGFPYIQYPWRFLTFTVLGLSILSVGIIFLLDDKRLKIIYTCFVIGLTLWVNAKLFIPQFIKPGNQAEYISDTSIRYKISKISDEYLPNDLQRPLSDKDIVWEGLSQSNRLTLTVKQDLTTKKEYTVNALDSENIITNIAYFPGWLAFIDGKEIPIRSKSGRVAMDIPAGSHALLFRFSDTPVRIFSNIISLLSLFLLGYVTIKDIPWLYCGDPGKLKIHKKE